MVLYIIFQWSGAPALSAGVLSASVSEGVFLMYSCTPCPPTPPPSCSLHYKVLTVVQEKQDAVFWKDPYGDRMQNDQSTEGCYETSQGLW